MKEQILKLCKRLNDFSIEEIETISELDSDELMPILSELVADNLLLVRHNRYYFIKKIKKRSAGLPLMFQYHSNEIIDFMIKGFCSDVDVKTMINLFGIGKNVMDKFYSYFRNILYEKQKAELIEYFEKEPKIGQERLYMTAKVYLYLYNHKLYVSEKMLKSNYSKKHTEEERLEIKNIYLRSFRKVLSKSFAYRFNLHLSEEIWKWGKDYKQRYSAIKHLLFA